MALNCASNNSFGAQAVDIDFFITKPIRSDKQATRGLFEALFNTPYKIFYSRDYAPLEIMYSPFIKQT